VQTDAERRAAIESLLPIVEQHLNPEVDPRPDTGERCLGVCHSCELSHCSDELWNVEYERLRGHYPLRELEYLLSQLMYEHANWATALYWVYVQPWDGFERTRREEYAADGVAWISAEWAIRWPRLHIPTYIPRGMGRERTKAERIEDMLSAGFSYQRIVDDVGCSRRDIAAISRTVTVRSGQEEHC